MGLDHEQGMKRLHEDCVWVKYLYWKALGMERRPDSETLLTECQDK